MFFFASCGCVVLRGILICLDRIHLLGRLQILAGHFLISCPFVPRPLLGNNYCARLLVSRRCANIRSAVEFGARLLLDTKKRLLVISCVHKLFKLLSHHHTNPLDHSMFHMLVHSVKAHLGLQNSERSTAIDSRDYRPTCATNKHRVSSEDRKRSAK